MYCLFSRFCINFKLAENHHLKYIHNWWLILKYT
jgi:hypothetical protein